MTPLTFSAPEVGDGFDPGGLVVPVPPVAGGSVAPAAGKVGSEISPMTHCSASAKMVILYQGKLSGQSQ